MFSVGGAITAPELHRAAMDQLMKQLVFGGMPLQVADDVINPKEFDATTGEPTNEVTTITPQCFTMLNDVTK